jgi:hypothetical protein
MAIGVVFIEKIWRLASEGGFMELRKFMVVQVRFQGCCAALQKLDSPQNDDIQATRKLFVLQEVPENTLTLEIFHLT